MKLGPETYHYFTQFIKSIWFPSHQISKVYMYKQQWKLSICYIEMNKTQCAGRSMRLYSPIEMNKTSLHQPIIHTGILRYSPQCAGRSMRLR